MEGVIDFTGSGLSWRLYFCQKQNFFDGRFCSIRRGFQKYAAVQQQTTILRSQHRKLVRNAPTTVKGNRFWCILPPESTCSPSFPEDDEIFDSAGVTTVSVKFILQRKCDFGQRFNVIGEELFLGAWDPGSAVPLEWSDDHIWTTELKVPVGKSYEFKFLLTGPSGEIEWQPGPNRVFKVSSGRSSPLVVMEPWVCEPLLVSELAREPEMNAIETQVVELEVEEQKQLNDEPDLKTETDVAVEQGLKDAESEALLEEIHKADGDHGSGLKEASLYDMVEDVMDAESDHVENVVMASRSIATYMVDPVAEGPTFKTDGKPAPRKTFSGESEGDEENVFRAKTQVARGSSATREEANFTSLGPDEVASVSANNVADPLAKAPPAEIEGTSAPEKVMEYEVSVQDENEAENVRDIDVGIE